MSLKKSMEEFRDYLKNTEPFLLLLGGFIALFAFIFKNEFENEILQLMFLGFEGVFFVIIIALFIMLIVWTFFQLKEYGGNILITFSLLFIFMLVVFFVQFTYFKHPFVFLCALSLVIWFLWAYIIFDISYSIRILNIIKKRKWYIHSIINLIITFVIGKLLINGIMRNPFYNDTIDMTKIDFLYWGQSIFLLSLLFLIFDSFISIFNKSIGIGWIKQETNNFRKSKFITIKLINKIKSEWYGLKQEIKRNQENVKK